jgi:hypothetical protein
VLSTVRAHPLWRTRNFAGFSCFPSHSGHRAVVHHSCSETCGVCLTQRPFCPQTARRNRRATWPRLKWPGLPFFGTAKRETGVLIGTQSTHYPRHCRRHHDLAVTGLWLASLHDGKRGTSQISQGDASLYARTLLERQCGCVGAFEPTPTTRRSARAVRTTGNSR